MTAIEKKLSVLLKVAKELNANNITWAIGASLLLYLKKITDSFNDIDIMIAEDDVEKAKSIFLTFGSLKPRDSNVQYKTKEFMEFIIEGVDFDVMAGFIIVNNNFEYYFPLENKDIKEFINIQDIKVPLQSIEDWLIYYKLMNRTDKVNLINNYLANK